MSTKLLGSRWISIVVTLLAAVCVYAIRQADADLFGYLAYGRLFAERGGPTGADPFAYTSASFHWVAFEYLSQMILWNAYDSWGPLGLIALKCAVGGVAVFCLWSAIRTTTDIATIWVPVFLFATSTLTRFLVFRPQLFTFAGFACFIAVLFRFIQRGKSPLWLLPLVMVFWANVHGGFLAGLGAIGLAILIQTGATVGSGGSAVQTLKRVRPLLWVLGLCIVATFLTPQQVELWRYVLTEVTHTTNRRYIAEWQPVSWNRDAWSATALVFMAGLVSGVAWIGERRGVRVNGLRPWQWWLSCVPLLAMAFSSVRHVPLAAIWTAPVITLLTSACARSQVSERLVQWWLASAALMLMPVILTLQYVSGQPRPRISTGGTILGPTHPCRVVRFMKESGIRGNVFTPLWWGAYLIWEGYPALRVSMDGRNISLYSRQMVEENLKFYTTGAEAAYREVPFQYDTHLLLMPSDTPALDAVRSDRRWRQIYADSDALLFERADAPTVLVATRATTPPSQPCPQELPNPQR